MFCSKCGKTLVIGAEACPYCGLEIGNSRFAGSLYTSAQTSILPGDDVRSILTRGYTHSGYTRTTYTRTPEVSDRGDADTRTTYRPAYNGDSIPEDMRRELRESRERAQEEEPEQEYEFYDREAYDREPPEDLSEEAATSLEAVEDELQMDDVDWSAFRAKPIESVGQSGISSDANEVIQKIESVESKKQAKQKKPAYGEYEEPVNTTVTEGEVIDAPEVAQAEVFDDLEDYEEYQSAPFGVKQIIRIVAAVVAVAVVAVGGVLWLRYVRSNHSTSPIENVRQELYDSGVALMKKHASTDYEQEILEAFSNTGSDFTTLSAALTSSQAEVDALRPDETTENEGLFMNALNQIEKNISNCITSDAMEMSSTVAAGAGSSEVRWAIVNNSISMLENATSATGLTAIINGQVVAVQTAAPEPTATPSVNYNTLSKGQKSEEVKALQERLIELGYLNDTADGAFGNKTMTAVKIFQQVVGMPVTGVADNATLIALYADDAPMADPSATVAPEDATGADEPEIPEEDDDTGLLKTSDIGA